MDCADILYAAQSPLLSSKVYHHPDIRSVYLNAYLDSSITNTFVTQQPITAVQINVQAVMRCIAARLTNCHCADIQTVTLCIAARLTKCHCADIQTVMRCIAARLTYCHCADIQTVTQCIAAHLTKCHCADIQTVMRCIAAP